MDHLDVGEFWNANADVWTQLARAGYDVYRDQLNTPAFFANLPAVEGLRGLDIGCGEGHNTRLLAARGAQMTAVDIAPKFVQHAIAQEDATPLGIDYQVASAVVLPFADRSFDFATAFMSLMDIPELEMVLSEVHRVLRPGGFFQFSIAHPCFDTPSRRNLRGEDGKTTAIAVGDYFGGVPDTIEEWIFGAAPAELRANLPKFRIPKYHRPLSQWVSALLTAGFAISYMHEPCPDEATVAYYPSLQDSRVVAYFLHVRCQRT